MTDNPQIREGTEHGSQGKPKLIIQARPLKSRAVTNRLLRFVRDYADVLKRYEIHT